MLFNSIEFFIFLPIVFILYWSIGSNKRQLQNLLLLTSSYFFYGWWDWRFLSLIAGSSAIDYIVGLQLHKTDKNTKRKLLVSLSIISNLGVLGFFKYYNFFISSISDSFTFFGSHISTNRLNIILPVGISFYTFQTLSYTIDVYRRKIFPRKSPIEFFTFVSFFPQLVAGPIERAADLLPQFEKNRYFSYDKSVDGMRLVLWGFFQKLVIADNAAIFVNRIFKNPNEYIGSTLFLGATLFAFQIYGDFSGYSNIARGVARFFGFNLSRNFHYPYFSRNIAEFWHRWHISLSSWFRDYLYIPLGGNRQGELRAHLNIAIVFLVSGLWHGANWTFVAWGAIHALLFLPLAILKRNKPNKFIVAHGKHLPSIADLLQIGLTFFLTTVAWIFFRAENISSAFSYIKRMFTYRFISRPDILSNPSIDCRLLLIAISFLIIIEWINRNKDHPLELSTFKPLYRKALYSTIVLWFFLLATFGSEDFIYFQF